MLRSNPSADPGAKIEGWAVFFQKDAAHLPLRDWHQSDKPTRPKAVIPRHDAILSLANTKRPKFLFTLNQDIDTKLFQNKSLFECALSQAAISIAIAFHVHALDFRHSQIQRDMRQPDDQTRTLP